MDSNNDNGSLDKDVDSILKEKPMLRPRKRAGLWTTLVAIGAYLLSGCFAKDIRSMKPDLYRPKAEAYENNLPNVAETMGLYDKATKTYDAAKVRAEAEKQLKLKDPKDPTSYEHLFGYTDVDQLKATNYSLGKVIEQNNDYIEKNKADPAKKADIDKRKKENEELEKLKEAYQAALVMYNEVGAADPGRPDSERMRCSLALGAMEYGKNTKEGRRTWKVITRERKDTWGTSVVGDDADREFVGERYFSDVERAWAVRKGKKKKGIWAGIGAAALTGLIYSLTQDDDNGGTTVTPENNGGEEGGPGGR
jgi:hypothetical protein